MNRATTHVTKQPTTLLPQHIVDAYMHLMQEYIDAFGKFTAETSAVQYDCMFYVGINIINKVYEYMLMKYTHNLEKLMRELCMLIHQWQEV